MRPISRRACRPCQESDRGAEDPQTLLTLRAHRQDDHLALLPLQEEVHEPAFIRQEVHYGLQFHLEVPEVTWWRGGTLNPAANQSSFPPPSRRAGVGHAAELSQWLRSQHSPGCDAQDPLHSGTAANELCMLADSSQRNPPCTPVEHPLKMGTSSPSALTESRWQPGHGLWSRDPLLL